MTTTTTAVSHIRASELRWHPMSEGLRVALLRQDPSGWASTFLAFDKGARAALHTHPGGEELYVVRGRIRIGADHLAAGDYLYTPPGGVHDAEAEEETLLFVIVPGGVEFIA